MCTRPVTVSDPVEGITTFACRVCKECIDTRRNDWVARCVAEMAVSGYTLPIDMTYRNNEDGTLPDSAKAFKYSDVSDFLKRLREAYFRKYKVRDEIRFIVAGENGSDNDRVHWHMVLFADKDLSALGKWSDFWFKPIKGPRTRRMDQWSLWGHGHVVTKEASQEGIQYVLKYALKDQFNVVNAKGHARETKSLTHAASKFNMSKYPPLGFRYLERKCDEWEEEQRLPTKLEIKPPGYNGFWWVKGKMRDYMLERLYKINEKRKRDHGRDCPQFNTLLASLVDGNKDWETLIYGPQTQEYIEDFDRWKWQEELGHSEVPIRKNCGGPIVCKKCFRGLGRETKEEHRRWYYEQQAEYVQDTTSPQGQNFDEWWRAKKQINPFCTLGDLQDRKDAFRP